jgi:hypothetical protein
MKTSWLLIERYLYTTRTTIGHAIFQDENFVTLDNILKKELSHTLEDTARPGNIKVFAETCLPGGLECDVSLFENAHYGKTIIFHTEKDGITILFNNLKWTGCLFHNGATFEHTEGCVLGGANLNLPVYKDGHVITEPIIYGGTKDIIRSVVEERIKAGGIVKARFINLDFMK